VSAAAKAPYLAGPEPILRFFPDPTIVKKQVEYDATLWAQRDAERGKRFAANLQRQAKRLGYTAVPMEEKPAV
jgi:hypothetical protein